jgi:hypothetical protein
MCSSDARARRMPRPFRPRPRVYRPNGRRLFSHLGIRQFAFGALPSNAPFESGAQRLLLLSAAQIVSEQQNHRNRRPAVLA